MSTTKKLNRTTRKRRSSLAAGSAKHVIEAFAIVNVASGRIMLTDLSHTVAERRETPAIYMTRSAAEYYRRSDERIVRVAIQETGPNTWDDRRRATDSAQPNGA